MTKILHFIWVGSPLPMWAEHHIQEWRRLNPSWTYRVWDDQDLDWLTNRALYDRAEKLVPADAVGQFRSDIARYEILLRHGGFYADVDTVPLRPLDQSITQHAAWAAKEDAIWVGNTYLYAEPQQPVMAALVAGLPQNIRAYQGKRPNKLSGPQYLTPLWMQYNCAVGQQEHWFPYSYSHVKKGTLPTIGPDTYAVHEWRHTKEMLRARRGV